MVEKLKKKVEPVAVSTPKVKAVPKKTTTIIAKCDCVNEYQDKTYGKGMRAKNSKGTGYRCTVCGKI
jgi:predicted SprT family Zn-dependent metalloprotease